MRSCTHFAYTVLAHFFLMFPSRVIIKGQFSLPSALDKTEGPREDQVDCVTNGSVT